MEDKPLSRIKSLLVLLALAAQVPLASATVTYAVGSCKPSLPSYPTIQDALDATPAPNVVEVCPGTYAEQVVISIPVTLEGISAGNSTQATISVPPGGLVVNATNDYGYPMAVQVLVQNVAGEVKLNNFIVDGTGNDIAFGSQVTITGVFYANSPGTLSHLTVQNQSGDYFGTGIWVQGGSANPSVTVESCNLQGFDNSGILTGTNSSTSELKATIKGNYVTEQGTASGIILGKGATVSVSENLITGYFSILVEAGGWGSVSKNTIFGSGPGVYGGKGITAVADGVAVTFNEIFNSGFSTGIQVQSSVAPVTGNIITESGPAIDFDNIAGRNVHSNTILGAEWGLVNVPTSAVTSDTFYNAGSIRCASSGC
jgi:hypothetical protein